ncbi:MAG: phosphate ABC transporter permease subunit PstC [Mucispirillum sp.]|nr:phosphate ABC transporter permease subunit PstC [Mucispirillum sp.]
MKETSNFSFYKDKFFLAASLISALSILLIIIGIIVSLFIQSFDAIKAFGFFNFIFSTSWDYNEEIFGAGRALLGSILTSFIAIIIAAPMGIGMAVFIVEMCPSFLKGFISTAIELLAAIPSIIYGMWGLFIFAPFLENTLQKWVSGALGDVPVIGSFFQINYAGGIGLLTSGIVLSIMIVPFIASIAREALSRVPRELKESGYGLGAEKWETIRDVSLPYTKTAIWGGIIIALGRALGETMAIAYIIGNMNISLTSVFDPYVTVTSVLVNEFNEASGLQMSSLFFLALLLFVLNFLTLITAKVYISRSR